MNPIPLSTTNVPTLILPRSRKPKAERMLGHSLFQRKIYVTGNIRPNRLFIIGLISCLTHIGELHRFSHGQSPLVGSSSLDSSRNKVVYQHRLLNNTDDPHLANQSPNQTLTIDPRILETFRARTTTSPKRGPLGTAISSRRLSGPLIQYPLATAHVTHPCLFRVPLLGSHSDPIEFSSEGLPLFASWFVVIFSLSVPTTNYNSLPRNLDRCSSPDPLRNIIEEIPIVCHKHNRTIM